MKHTYQRCTKRHDEAVQRGCVALLFARHQFGACWTLVVHILVGESWQISWSSAAQVGHSPAAGSVGHENGVEPEEAAPALVHIAAHHVVAGKRSSLHWRPEPSILLLQWFHMGRLSEALM